MDGILSGIVVGLALAMLLSLYRLLSGPTIWDRLTGLGLLGTKTIILLLVIGYVVGREDVFIDITLAYTLISFIGTLALAKYFEAKSREGDLPESEPGQGSPGTT